MWLHCMELNKLTMFNKEYWFHDEALAQEIYIPAIYNKQKIKKHNFSSWLRLRESNQMENKLKPKSFTFNQ